MELLFPSLEQPTIWRSSVWMRVVEHRGCFAEVQKKYNTVQFDSFLARSMVCEQNSVVPCPSDADRNRTRGVSADSHFLKSILLVIQKKIGLLKSNGNISDRYRSWSTADNWPDRRFQSILRTKPVGSIMRSRCIFFQQDDLPRFSMAFFARTLVAAPGSKGEILTEP